MDHSWDDLASTWDDRDGVQLYAKQAYESLLPHAQALLDEPALRLLDFGAGTGCLTAYLARPHREIVAVDTSAQMLSVLDGKGLPGVKTLCAELTAATVPTLTDMHEPFGLIVASSVCAFVPDFANLVRLFKQLLKPGGRFVQWDWEKQDAGAEGKGFSRAQIRDAYLAAGLVERHIGTAFEMTIGEKSSTVVMGVAERP